MNDVVRGEASESEDEALSLNLKQEAVLASEVCGEASESDEDVYEKSLGESNVDFRNSADSMFNRNLLKRKLIENNVSISRSLVLFVKNIVTAASKKLLSTDQLLIKSQTSMQSVLLTLNQAELNIKQLYEKTDAVFTENFIPTISLPS